MLAKFGLGDVGERGQVAVAEAMFLGLTHQTGVGQLATAFDQLRLERHDILDVVEEPRIDLGQGEDLVDGHLAAQGLGDVPELVPAVGPQFVLELFERNGLVDVLGRQGMAVDLQRANGLLQGLFEGPPDGHRLADRLHLDRQFGRGLRKFFERESGPLDHAIVDRRLEAGGRLLGNVVGNLVERIANREQRGDLGDGKSCRLRGQRRAARDARVHLDDVELAVGGVDGELDVGTARLDADGADDLERGLAHDLVFFVGERLGGRDGDAVARVDAHGIEVLDGTDDDHVVLAVAHDLELVFLPSGDGLLDEDLAVRTEGQSPPDVSLVLLRVVGDVAAGAAERIGRADDRGKTDLLDDSLGLFPRMDVSALGDLEADVLDGLLESVAFLGLLDRAEVRAEELDAVFLEDAAFGQGDGGVETGLAPQGGQEAVGLLATDDPLDDFGRDRLDVRPIGHFGIGHDGGGVAVDQDDLETLPPEDLAGLSAGIVEFAGLADDDRARSDDQNLVDVFAFWHRPVPSS